MFIARQLGKHQAGLSWNEVSRRYVDVGIEFFSPDSWRSRPVDGMKQGSGEDVDAIKTALIDEAYEVHLDECMKLYDGMIDLGVAPEQARMVLPQSMMVDWVWTGNLFAFYHVYRLRIDGHAQKEAQEFAQKLGTILEDLFPHCMKALKNDSAKN
ncbi:Thymidylate synthase ThyX [compost metagenome]